MSNKDIVCFDVETTGLNPKEDYIVQLAMVKIDSVSFEEKDRRDWYIKPIHAYAMSPIAQEKTGLTKEFIDENGVNLKDIAADIISFIDGCDILTYNGNGFDINFLYKDLKLVGVDLDLDNRTFFDAFLTYKLLHPSTLASIYKSYTGQELEGAHNAYNDVRATITVFEHLCKETQSDKPLEVMTGMTSNQLTSPENSIHKIVVDGTENIVFSFGKYKDSEFCDVYKKDPLYVQWWGQNVASDYTKKVINEYVKSKKK